MAQIFNYYTSVVSTISLYPTTANMTKGLPLYVNNYAISSDSFSNSSLSTLWTKTTMNGAVSETTALIIACTSKSTTNYNFTYKASPYNGVYRTLSAGDFDVVVKFSSYKAGLSINARYGIYVSPASATTNSRYGIIQAITSTSTSFPAAPYKFESNSSNASTMTQFSSARSYPGATPLYARINRTGTVLTFYASTNGTTWATNSSQSTCSTDSYYLAIGDIRTTGLSKTASTIHVTDSYSLPLTNTVYARLEPTSAYAGDKGTRLRVYANDGIIYTACATTS